MHEFGSRKRVGPLGIGLLILLVAVVVFFAVFDPQVAGTLDRIERTGIVRIGYANEAPYGYLDSETGEITGEAPEIAKVILRRMGATDVRPVVTEFGSLIPGLKAWRFDIIAAGMYITPERAEEIDFSNPTYAIGEAFLVKAGNPLELHSFEDAAASDRARLGVMGGSVEHGYAKDLGVPEERIVVFPDYPSAVEGLKTDRVSAVAATVLTAKDLLRKADDENLELAEPFHNPVINGATVKGFGAFGFRQKDDAFRQAFNRHLDEYIGSEEHLRLVRPFGFGEATLPGDITAEEVVQMKQ